MGLIIQDGDPARTRLLVSPSSVEYQLRKVFRNLRCPF
jgi:hypothetical protein